jgi:limonene-1,2-epoxide hydrolase
MEPAVGKAAIRDVVTQYVGAMRGLHAQIHRQLVGTNVVMNERTDRFIFNGKETSVPVCGVFEIESGKIKAWREYYDGTLFAQD